MVVVVNVWVVGGMRGFDQDGRPASDLLGISGKVGLSRPIDDISFLGSEVLDFAYLGFGRVDFLDSYNVGGSGRRPVEFRTGDPPIRGFRAFRILRFQRDEWDSSS